MKFEADTQVKEVDMTEGKIRTNEPILNELSGKIKYVHYFFNMLFIANIFVWIFLTVLAAISVFQSSADTDNGLGQSVFRLFTILAIGGLISTLLRIIVDILRDVSKSKSPFSTVQIKRIRLLAILFVAYGVFDSLLSSNVSSMLALNGMWFGSTTATSTAEITIALNFTAFIAAVIIFALSIVFEYGTNLQQQADSFF